MEIKKLCFERKETEIKEFYIDEFGKTRERIRTVMLPTGNVVLKKDEQSEGLETDTTK